MKRQGRLAPLLLALSLLVGLLAQPAVARLPVPQPDAGAWQLQGSGEMRWFGFALYSAKLWRSGDAWRLDLPHALELTYRRSISDTQLVNASIDEMRRLGQRDETQLQRWRTQLERVFPSVREGDTIVGLHEPGRGARFYFNGKLNGEIDDAALAAAFFAIWLDPRTREPALRASLLAEAAR